METLEFGLLQALSIQLTSSSHFDIFFSYFFIFCFFVGMSFDIDLLLIHASSSGKISPLTVIKEADTPT